MGLGNGMDTLIDSMLLLGEEGHAKFVGERICVRHGIEVNTMIISVQ